MKKFIAIVIVLTLGFTLMNYPATFSNLAVADSGEHFPFESTDETIIRALEYLRNQQTMDGDIGGFSVSGWVVMVISAAGEDPHDWGNIVEYLRKNVNRVDINRATDWERQTLAIAACGEKPRNFGGVNHVGKVESFYDGTQIGSPANLYDDFFGILALVAGGVDKESSIIQNVRAFIKDNQGENGGWGDVDATAAAIMALIAAGENPNSRSVKDALSFIRGMQTETGGFHSWGTANAASTSWAVNAIVATGGDPTSDEWEKNGKDPVDYLVSLQQESGCFNWAVGQNTNPVWMTSYVIPALLGSPYPVKIYNSEEEGNEPNKATIVSKTSTQKTSVKLDPASEDDFFASVDEWTGPIRIEGKNNLVWSGVVSVSSSTIIAKNESSGEEEEYFIPYPSVLGALDGASKQGSFSYTVTYYPSWDAFFVNMIAGESDWWHYWVDYELPMVGAGKYELTDGDDEVLWGYLESWEAHVLRISIDKSEVKKNEEFTVSVYNETMFPVKDAVVYVDSMTFMTDENGKAIVRIDTVGTYESHAEKDGYVRSEEASVLVKKKTKAEIARPERNSVYFMNGKLSMLFPVTFILGHIDIEVEASEDIAKVMFYVNDRLKYVDTQSPFNWRWNELAFFKKTIKVVAFADGKNSVIDETDVFIFNFPFLMSLFKGELT